jgi:hypothetical protein
VWLIGDVVVVVDSFDFLFSVLTFEKERERRVLSADGDRCSAHRMLLLLFNRVVLCIENGFSFPFFYDFSVAL